MTEISSDIRMFNELYREYKARFVFFAKMYVRDEFVAEDIVVDSLLYYWENKENLSHQSNIPAYVLTIVKNKCLNYLRHERTREDIVKQLQDQNAWELQLRIMTLEACEPEFLFSEELRKIATETIDSLPSLSKEIFIRSRYENQSNKEIAEALGLSVKSIEYHITKTLKILRKMLIDYFPLWLFFWC